MPKVSIVLPTHNGSRWIMKAIKSIQAQSFSDWELLVVDDGSIDETSTLVKEISSSDSRIMYIRNEHNIGLQKSLNKGIELSKGEYVARIDDDDRWIDENKLMKQVEFLDKNKDYVLVGTGAIVVNQIGEFLFKYLLPQKDSEIRKSILSKNCFCHSSIVFRKKVVSLIGYYGEEENIKHIEDYDLWLRMGTIGKLHNLPLYAVEFMSREGSVTSNNRKDQFKKNINLIKKYKKNYPNYSQGLIWGYIRFFLYRLFKLLPVSIKVKIISIYKRY